MGQGYLAISKHWETPFNITINVGSITWNVPLTAGDWHLQANIAINGVPEYVVNSNTFKVVETSGQTECLDGFPGPFATRLSSGPDVGAIVGGVVGGVVGLAILVGGGYFYWRRRQRRSQVKTMD